MKPKNQEWDEDFKEKIKIMEKCELGKFHKFICHKTQIRSEKEGEILNIMIKKGQYIQQTLSIEQEGHPFSHPTSPLSLIFATVQHQECLDGLSIENLIVDMNIIFIFFFLLVSIGFNLISQFFLCYQIYNNVGAV
ncbi:unnamed protein product [Paramecium octaurelia]|uniref:Uncharacterized protein n=1 Tax=Paramecium octaurelia TaxID=43137 RepID=A0A8S1TVU6_PAROT|nr:unnamed protein product [Paramecium octaurelia]